MFPGRDKLVIIGGSEKIAFTRKSPNVIEDSGLTDCSFFSPPESLVQFKENVNLEEMFYSTTNIKMRFFNEKLEKLLVDRKSGGIDISVQSSFRHLFTDIAFISLCGINEDGTESINSNCWSSTQLSLYKVQHFFEQRQEISKILWFYFGLDNRNTSVRNNLRFLKNKITVKLMEILKNKHLLASEREKTFLHFVAEEFLKKTATSIISPEVVIHEALNLLLKIIRY